ncbi:GCN5-related N-acetyltransferase [Gracilibacillus halophilus YIM-C55.5]|uniref:GCN5-related N-acetyltransferase n=1 Tax=Gracilibacillus halophilus YIM-C55.5 TaxID=1308866 RepID=N4W9Y5_9BACI|nr:GNAT family protein [Gracilibacillus halophilus]ENH96059.1 GCN5-related N-acetyltransferase [Gracilibacillus halophilus YIM-C55.5]
MKGFKKHFIDIPTFETGRLCLRKLTLADLDDVFNFCSNPKVAEPMTWETNKTKEVTHEFLKSVVNGYEKGESAEWAIVWKTNQRVIGVVAIINWSNTHKSIEVGYFLSESYWAQGIVTEALIKVIQYGFSELKANRIEGRCDIHNVGSQKVLKKVGMTYEGTLRKNEFIKGEFRDTQIYSILADEFNWNEQI